jgi:hypothetical protein
MILDKDRSSLQSADPKKFDALRLSLLALVARAEKEASNKVLQTLVEAGAPVYPTNPSSTHDILPPAAPPADTNITAVPSSLACPQPSLPGPVTELTVNEVSVALPTPALCPSSRAFLASPLAGPTFPPCLVSDVAAPAAPLLAHKLTVACCSWNVGNAPPSEASVLRAWLPHTDVIAVGSQENQYAPRKGYRSHVADWEATLAVALGPEYELVAAERMGQILLHVFVRAKLVTSVDRVESSKSSEATGIANVGTNKGGVAVAVNVLGTTLAFVSAHLAAHTPQVDRRNADVAEILAGIRFKGQSQGVGLLNMFAHVFFMGDLNYRLERAGADKEPLPDKFAEVVSLAAADDYAALLDSDQLREQLRLGRVFRGFTDAPPLFKPSFKVLRDTVGPEYTDKRTPSYCDRVLWHSLPGRAGEVRLQSFRAAHAVTSSDHKPVAACFDVCVPVAEAAHDLDESLAELRLVLLSASAEGLPAGDVDGSSDPFLKVSSPFVNQGKGAVSTVKQNTLAPTWARAELPELSLHIGTLRRLARLALPVAVWDEDVASSSALAAGNLSLAALGVGDLEVGPPGTEHTSAVRQVRVPLSTKGNLPAGWLTVEAVFAYRWRASTLFEEVAAQDCY